MRGVIRQAPKKPLNMQANQPGSSRSPLEGLGDLQQVIQAAQTILKTYEEMKKLAEGIHQAIASVATGPRGPQGPAGIGRDGKNGTNGKTPSTDELKRLIKGMIPEVKDGRPGKDADINTFFETLKTKKLSIADIDGLQEVLANLGPKVGGYVHGGGDTVTAGTGVTISTNSNGDKVINTTASGTKVRDEDLGANGSGVTFTLLHTPVANTLQIFRGGAKQRAGAGKDYTISGTTVTLSATLSTGEELLADYEY